MQQTLWSRNFRLLFASKLLKVLADNFTWTALIWLMLDLGGGAVSSSVLNLASLVPMMVLGLFVGPMLTRGKLTRRMFESDALRALIVLTIPVCHALGILPIWQFYAVAFIQSVCGSVYNPASVALLPQVVGKDLLQKANAVMESSNQVSRLVSLAGAGAMITWFSASTTLAITVGLFLLSALLVLAIRLPDEQTVEVKKREKTPYWTQIREGFQIFRRYRILLVLNVYCIFLNAGYQPYEALLPAYVHDSLHLTAFQLTMLRSGSMVGAFLVGVLLARVTIKRNGLMFAMAGVLQGVMLMTVGHFTGLSTILIASFVIGACMTAINVPEMVIIQSVVPSHQQATVFSVGTSISTMFMPLAGALVAVLSHTYDIGTLILCGGALMTVAGVVTIFFMPRDAEHVEQKGETTAA
ncbi:MFS transporter [Tumebacillus sp. ITR2]|uniref:MFS transporter n=1 Tax=Tumebacillus amylolyticus TaxID=2801339 RepID=A0ABS1JE98_9BACL|nr:MFS transporter [Tumebacillus amylolyticus]MBL0388535.1 MFS transporter [Tumebacillus amylolyticus]